MGNNNDDSNEVGYGNPPKATRFKKGQSGNPNGRPKNKPSMVTDILQAIRARVVINVNGCRQTVTKGKAATSK
jgi:hypothetical protein